jgi:hypothetical protein
MAGVRDKLSAVIVTTPQAVALMDGMKCLSFTRAVELPVLGLIENMSGYVCPCCGEASNVFSTGGGQEMARREGLKFLGSLPVDTELVEVLDSGGRAGSNGVLDSGRTGTGFGLLEKYQATATAKIFSGIMEMSVT